MGGRGGASGSGSKQVTQKGISALQEMGAKR